MAIASRPVRQYPGAMLLPLHNGDHLTRTEFERRYAAMTNVKKAELIEGVVHIPSPVSTRHSEANASVAGCLFVYAAATPGVRVGENVSVRLDADNEVQPDALLRIDQKFGRNSHISDDGFVEGAPELVVEIAASSAAYDLYEKLNVYRRTGVREYVVWQVHEGVIDWFLHEDGRFVAQASGERGILISRVFPGLWIDAPALVAGDLAAALATVRLGIEAAVHGEFCAALDALNKSH